MEIPFCSSSPQRTGTEIIQLQECNSNIKDNITYKHSKRSKKTESNNDNDSDNYNYFTHNNNYGMAWHGMVPKIMLS